MQLSEDEIDHPMIQSYGPSSPSAPSADVVEVHELLPADNHLGNISMTSSSTSDDESTFEAIEDAEISLKMDSPPREGAMVYGKNRVPRASLTTHTEAALHVVSSMFGPQNDNDDSDDNTTDADDDRRDQYGDRDVTGHHAVHDATKDVTFWAQSSIATPKRDTSANESDLILGSSTDHLQRSHVDGTQPDGQYETRLSGQRYGEGTVSQSEPLLDWKTDMMCVSPSPDPGFVDPLSESSHYTSDSSLSFSAVSRSTTAFKPTRKPLSNMTPVYDENAFPSGAPFASASRLGQNVLGAKRVPLGEKPVVTQPMSFGNPSHPSLSASSHMTSSTLGYAPAFAPLDNGYRTPSDENSPEQFFPRENENDGYADEQRYEYNELVNLEAMNQNQEHVYRPLRYVPVGDNFNALTPITERTSECASTNLARYTSAHRHGLRTSIESDMGMDRYSQVGSDNEESELTPRANDPLGISHQLPPDGRVDQLLDFIPRRLDGMDLDLDSIPRLTTSDEPRPGHHWYTTSTVAPTVSADVQMQSDDLETGLQHNPSAVVESMDQLMRNRSLTSPPSHEIDSSLQSPDEIGVCEPCNPFAKEIVAILLEELDPPLTDYPGFRDLSDTRADKLAQLQKRCKARPRKQSHGGGANIEDATWEIELDGDTYFICEKLGEGAYGSVFRAIESIDEESMVMNDQTMTQTAMKVESPPNVYEFTILSQLHKTLSNRLCRSLIAPHRLYTYQDESFLILEYCDQGTLLDVVNRAAEIGVSPTGGGKGVEEVLAMFFTVELMRVVEGLHEAGFIHGDLKIDNCLVRLESLPGGSKSWSSTYDPEGGSGWEHKGLKLIDYGRSIDTNVFPKGQEFVIEWETDEYDCWEMRKGERWTFQPDYHGIIGIGYCLLFGKFMNEEDSIRPGFRRYHQIELWNELFEVCLRPSRVPNLIQFKECRIKMENWLNANCERNGKSLKGLLKKIEVASLSR